MLSSAAWPDSNLRHLHGRGGRPVGAGLRNHRFRRAWRWPPNPRGRSAAQREAFDRILGNHMLYCTVCDNNNGNCTVHNTTKLLAVEHQKIPFKPKPFEVDNSNPFYRYDPDQCILCGRCVEACQNVQVNETLSIRWEDPHPRVLWDGGAKHWRVELRFLRPLRHRLSLQRADGKIHAWSRGISDRACRRPRWTA